MKQKIEWYQEVLEIEPNSGIFFPLAKMLAQDGQTDRALHVLRGGAARHPNHIEARLLLIELLSSHGPKEELWREIDAVGARFAAYPGFWQAWGERLHASSGPEKDAGIALFLFAAGLRHEQISWSDIIGHGLLHLLAAKTAEKTAVTLPAPALSPEPAKEEEAAAAPSVVAVPEPEPAVTFTAQPAREEEARAAPGAGEEEEAEEPFSLRTRSMADILAEQGDIQGALDIYTELAAASVSEQEKAALLARMDELAHTQTSSLTGAVSTSAKPEEAESKNRLAEMLEALAQRLESRSLQ